MASRPNVKLPVVACAAALALGVGIVVGGATESSQASAQGAAAHFSVTPSQMQINQRIGVAGVRRANEALTRLDAIEAVFSGLTPSAAGAKGDAGPAGPAGAKGPQGPEGPKGADATVSAEKWGVIGRNTIGSPMVAFRAGPWGGSAGDNEPPAGVGSLGISVDGRAAEKNDREKMAFGNEVDFKGTTLDSINTISYSTYTDMDTGVQPPSLAIEIGEGADYASLNYVPEVAATHVWVQHDATTSKRWTLSKDIAGGACAGGALCTLAEVKAALPDVEISFSVGISFGRDTSFQGAVDALEINGTTYDFEPLGVVVTP